MPAQIRSTPEIMQITAPDEAGTATKTIPMMMANTAIIVLSIAIVLRIPPFLLEVLIATPFSKIGPCRKASPVFVSID